MGHHEMHDSRLAALYARSPKRVAFVDETGSSAKSARPFYLMSAVIYPGETLNYIRDELVDLVGRDFWHTTSAYNTELEDTLWGLLDYLCKEEAISLCAVDTAIDRFGGDTERARKHCFEFLTGVLVEQHDVDLIVYERRREGAEEDADHATTGALLTMHATRDVRFHAGTPSSEPILWTPDVVASALRRRLALQQPQWFEPIRSKTMLHKAQSGESMILPA